ncbi:MULTISPECIES: hypothetical protein [Protofrankia]|uniref:Uncharacterized protein n=1 Tax=Protofrankia coriariae TaxID=1562887 RepID=A0ABR5F557_9ACTN|nr:MULTISPECIES: hypothetical protein [Protofrankia]KLL11867.1 hypothetical protein FrCorBMG51_08585 [Protofrankia coriariae]ONH34247.1 hypothetical protein BL254_17150 [Protofrankia sp. BMG5.30]
MSAEPIILLDPATDAGLIVAATEHTFACQMQTFAWAAANTNLPASERAIARAMTGRARAVSPLTQAQMNAQLHQTGGSR